MTAVDRVCATGIVRLGSARGGFRYRLASGGRPPREVLGRIRSLRLPPAWRQVAIARSPRARLQAVGLDRAGRWQYVYHTAYVAARERQKYERLLRFGAALPSLRRIVRRDLRQPGMPRDKVLAAIVRILSVAYLRPGSEAYAAENGSYGIATLRRKHTRVEGANVIFDFPGKSGTRQHHTVADRQVARVIRRLLVIPGYEVFKYLDESGRPVDIKSAAINEYIKRHLGAAFSAKDFRTWAGTLICASALARVRAAPAHWKHRAPYNARWRRRCAKPPRNSATRQRCVAPHT